MNANATVHVIDDDLDVRRALTAAISSRGYQVESYGCAREFLETYEPQRAACVILDVPTQGVSGVRLQAALTAVATETPVILVSGIASVDRRIDAVTAGAIGYIEKPYHSETLLEHIDDAFATLRQREHERTARSEALKRFESLRRREKEVLALLVESRGSLSSRQISQHMGISPRTVEHYRSNLMVRMEADSVTQLVLQGILCGLPYLGAPMGPMTPNSDDTHAPAPVVEARAHLAAEATV